jgi:hypothetical protein
MIKFLDAVPLTKKQMNEIMRISAAINLTPKVSLGEGEVTYEGKK